MPYPSFRSRMRNTDFTGWAVGIFIALIVLGTIGVSIAWQNSRETYSNCTVEDKDRTTNSEGSSDARVYTDCGVFQVADNIWTLDFNSADTYALIVVGETYDFDTIGWRAGIFSQFPNILEVR